jgi:hypothetical protein
MNASTTMKTFISLGYQWREFALYDSAAHRAPQHAGQQTAACTRRDTFLPTQALTLPDPGALPESGKKEEGPCVSPRLPPCGPVARQQ